MRLMVSFLAVRLMVVRLVVRLVWRLVCRLAQYILVVAFYVALIPQFHTKAVRAVI